MGTTPTSGGLFIVNLVTSRLRSLLIALAVLALSATVALAGRPAFSAPHNQVAGQNEQGDEQADGSEAPDADESEAPESEAPESPDASEADTKDESAGVHPDNHGLLVSEAAQADTPDGFHNHGAYVRTIAQNNQGHADAAAKHAKKH
jgi:hypothetical protein